MPSPQSSGISPPIVEPMKIPIHTGDGICETHFPHRWQPGVHPATLRSVIIACPNRKFAKYTCESKTNAVRANGCASIAMMSLRARLNRPGDPAGHSGGAIGSFGEMMKRETTALLSCPRNMRCVLVLQLYYLAGRGSN